MKNTLLCSDVPFIEALRKLNRQQLTDQLQELVGYEHEVIVLPREKQNINQLELDLKK